MNQAENTAQHNAYYGPLLRQDIYQEKKCLFLSFLIYSFSTNLLGTYYMPDAVVDPQDRGLIQEPTTKSWRSIKRPPPKDKPRWRKQQRCGWEAKGVRGFLFREMRKGWHRPVGGELTSVLPPHSETYLYTLQLPSMCKSATWVWLHVPGPFGMTLDYEQFQETGRGPIAELIWEQGDSRSNSFFFSTVNIRSDVCLNFFIRAAMKKNYKRLDKLLLWKKSIIY